MKKKIKIAVTGGIGSGKTEVCRILKDCGCAVFSCDEIARGIYKDAAVLDGIKKEFPDCVYDAEGNSPDRKKLAERVFSDRNKLEILNSITHNAIMKKAFEGMENSGAEMAFLEIPLLFETESQAKFDYVIVVRRERESRIDSVMKRSGMTREQVTERMKNQYDYDKTDGQAYIIIHNNSNLTDLKKEVLIALDKIGKNPV